MTRKKELIEEVVDYTWEHFEDESVYFLDDEHPDDKVFSIDDFDELFENLTPWEIAERVTGVDFSVYCDYFIFNGYGNLESLHEDEREDQYKSNLEGLLDYVGLEEFCDLIGMDFEELVLELGFDESDLEELE